MRSDRSTRLRRQALLLRSRRRRQASLLPAIVIAGLTLAGLAVTVALAAVAGTYSLYARDYVPVASQLEGQRGQLTAIFDRYGPTDGSFLGFLSNPSGAETYAISLDAVSPWMVAATVSTEDQQFWDHNGVNIRGTGRAVIALANGETEVGGGGSSITQQLVKNLYLTTDCTLVDGVRVCVAPRTLDRKAREMVYAFELERELTKEQILELYLNSVSYADRYVGIEAAAQGYFRKPAAELTIAEAALLAGVPSSPGRYHPRASCVTDEAGACLIDPEGRTLLGGAAKERQADVLSLMVQHGAITADEAEAAAAEPLAIWPLEQSSRADAWIENQVEPRLERMCIAGLLPLESGAASCLDSIRTAGYRVTTSLDQPLTNVARDVARTSIAEGLDNGCNCHNASIVTIDPTSGQILVYVENVDPTSSVPQVSGNIDQATEINQPGSSMKPIIYLAWMDILGRAPMHSFWDTNPLTLENPNDR
ncbi:MAG: transglycosylase domain-containing protein, partial [Tepidiformaceae bacterium]